MKTMIKIFALLVCCLIDSTPARAEFYIQNPCPHTACVGQPPKGKRPKRADMNPDKFRKELSKAIAKDAGFTKKEAQAFFPIFFEMKEQLRNIERKKNRAINRAAGNEMSEKDCNRILREMAEMDKKMLRTEHEYMTRLQKTVGARKLVKAISADRKFGRRMFKKMADKAHR